MDRPRAAASAGSRFLQALAPLALGAALVWASWPALGAMAHRWEVDPRYSHGYLVPLFAVYLLYARRGLLAGVARPAPFAGLALIACGEALRLAGTRYYLPWVEMVSILPSLAGLAALVGGWPALRGSGPSIAFLLFMVPLPYRVENAMGYPLQRLATVASTYLLQTAGLPAVAEGNIIHIDEAQIGVVEACNGLGMLLIFFAFATAFVLAFPTRPLVDRVVILVSAVPIALAANVARITATGILHQVAGGTAADAFYHDLAGWFMMPLAMAGFALELWLLPHLFVERPAPDRRVTSGRPVFPGL